MGVGAETGVGANIRVGANHVANTTLMNFNIDTVLNRAITVQGDPLLSSK
jgi:hypothetical protein